MNEESGPVATSSLKRAALAAGPALAGVMLLLGPPGAMTAQSWAVAALVVLMTIWWVSEALPISVTAMLPVVVLPAFGVMDVATAASAYANPLIFMFFGGFLIALALQRWQLHRRIALLVLSLSGQRADFLVGGFMAASALLSMWVSNTATAAMMLPIGLSVITLTDTHQDSSSPAPAQSLDVPLLLGIAFGANIGGMATLIGTPPNALLAAFMSEAYGIEIAFAHWFAIAFPLSVVLLALSWLALTRWAFPLRGQRLDGVRALIRRERVRLGRLVAAEWRVLAVFAAVVTAWILRPVIDGAVPGLQLSDASVAVAGAILLFVLPAGGRDGGALLEWRDTANMPWGVLVLVGGGLSLGQGVEHSGLSVAVAQSLAMLGGWPVWGMIGAIALLTIVLSHVTSNTATAATLLPLAAGLAASLGVDPLFLTVAVALAASCAFMLPVATPPNAIIFGSERIRIAEMVRGGLMITLIAIPLVTLVTLVYAVPMLRWLTGGL